MYAKFFFLEHTKELNGEEVGINAIRQAIQIGNFSPLFKNKMIWITTSLCSKKQNCLVFSCIWHLTLFELNIFLCSDPNNAKCYFLYGNYLLQLLARQKVNTAQERENLKKEAIDAYEVRLRHHLSFSFLFNLIEEREREFCWQFMYILTHVNIVRRFRKDMLSIHAKSHLRRSSGLMWWLQKPLLSPPCVCLCWNCRNARSAKKSQQSCSQKLQIGRLRTL